MVKVKKIIRIPGQKRFIVERDARPVLRSDLWLHKPGERKEPRVEGAREKAPPYNSYSRARIIKREESKVKRKEKRVATASAKAKAKAVNIDNKMKTKELWEASKARAVAAKKHEDGMREFVRQRVFAKRDADQGAAERRMRERAGPTLTRADWRGQPVYR